MVSSIRGPWTSVGKPGSGQSALLQFTGSTCPTGLVALTPTRWITLRVWRVVYQAEGSGVWMMMCAESGLD